MTDSESERDATRLDPGLTKDISLRAAEGYHPGIRAIVQNQDEGPATVWRAQSADPKGIPGWKTDGELTVLGDAVHAMPPLGGLAGNMAMRIAAMLVDALVKGRTADGWEEEVIARFEGRMRADAAKS